MLRRILDLAVEPFFRGAPANDPLAWAEHPRFAKAKCAPAIEGAAHWLLCRGLRALSVLREEVACEEIFVGPASDHLEESSRFVQWSILHCALDAEAHAVCYARQYLTVIYTYTG